MYVLRFFVALPQSRLASHADPSVHSLPVDRLSRNSTRALLQARAPPSTISTKPIQFAGGLPALDWVPNCHSNPITQRVRRKRQRLPPSLLIENASKVIPGLPEDSSPEAFPIKASDNSLRRPPGLPSLGTSRLCSGPSTLDAWVRPFRRTNLQL